MGIGMSLHKMARPRPSRPAFHRDVDATVSPIKGKFRVHFYVPKDYKRYKKLKGSFTLNGATGANHFRFSGRLRNRKLKPGRYRLVATPVVPGEQVVAAKAAFRIVR